MSEKGYVSITDQGSEVLDTREERTRHSRMRRSRLLGHFVPAVLLTCAVLLLFRKVFVCHGRYDAGKGLQQPLDTDEYGHKRVPLEAHIMSKCPDARDCLVDLIVPTMEKVSDKVDFKLSYIGSLDPNSDEISCKHGPSECLGNIIQLCAAHTYPDPKIYLGFSTCMTSQYSRVPDRDLVEGCANEHGIDFETLNACISDEGKGAEFLRNSIQRSLDNNVTKSCTVRLNGNVRCIRDGGIWYDCPGGSYAEDLVSDIKALYDADNASR